MCERAVVGPVSTDADVTTQSQRRSSVDRHVRILRRTGECARYNMKQSRDCERAAGCRHRIRAAGRIDCQFEEGGAAAERLSAIDAIERDRLSIRGKRTVVYPVTAHRN